MSDTRWRRAGNILQKLFVNTAVEFSPATVSNNNTNNNDCIIRNLGLGVVVAAESDSARSGAALMYSYVRVCVARCCE